MQGSKGGVVSGDSDAEGEEDGDGSKSSHTQEQKTKREIAGHEARPLRCALSWGSARAASEHWMGESGTGHALGRGTCCHRANTQPLKLPRTATTAFNSSTRSEQLQEIGGNRRVLQGIAGSPPPPHPPPRMRQPFFFHFGFFVFRFSHNHWNSHHRDMVAGMIRLGSPTIHHLDCNTATATGATQPHNRWTSMRAVVD